MQKTIVRRETDTRLDPHLHPVMARIFSARGITQIDELEHRLSKLLSFDMLENIKDAAVFLEEALIHQQRIVVIGDFDADGATATAVAISALRLFGFEKIFYLVPNRFTYGYGLTPAIVDLAVKTYQADILITVDNGIASYEGVERANTLGLKVLITDHHLPGSSLPKAHVIVNPNLPGDCFPSKSLAGCGVIFYVMLALRHHLREKQYFKTQGKIEPNLANLLDFVALGTIADVVNLDFNNRILVYQGLQRIRSGQCHPGILALLSVAGIKPEAIKSSDLAFLIAPRLNAAGRIEDMSLGIACLLEENTENAIKLAEKLNELNQERRSIEKQMQQDALNWLTQQSFEEKSLPYGLCLYDPNFHQGVIGILAGRIKDRFHRPVIAFAKSSETELKGSARSIPGIHIRDILDSIATRHPDLLQKFGGHAMAAGLSIQATHYKRFCRIFNACVEKHCTPDLLHAQIYTDGELSYQDLSLELAKMIEEAGPWGTAFPEPCFDNRFQVLQQQLLNNRHLKLRLSLPNYPGLFDAIAFSVDPNEWPKPKLETVRMVYRLETNTYRGMTKIQLLVEQLYPE